MRLEGAILQATLDSFLELRVVEPIAPNTNSQRFQKVGPIGSSVGRSNSQEPPHEPFDAGRRNSASTSAIPAARIEALRPVVAKNEVFVWLYFVYVIKGGDIEGLECQVHLVIEKLHGQIRLAGEALCFTVYIDARLAARHVPTVDNRVAGIHLDSIARQPDDPFDDVLFFARAVMLKNDGVSTPNLRRWMYPAPIDGHRVRGLKGRQHRCADHAVRFEGIAAHEQRQPCGEPNPTTNSPFEMIAARRFNGATRFRFPPLPPEPARDGRRSPPLRARRSGSANSLDPRA